MFVSVLIITVKVVKFKSQKALGSLYAYFYWSTQENEEWMSIRCESAVYFDLISLKLDL